MILNITVINNNGPGPWQEKTFELSQDGGSIGRGKSNTIVLHDPDRYISRLHASIFYRDGQYHLKDSSLAGTLFVNQEVDLHGNSLGIGDGDKVRIGDYYLIFSIPEKDGANLSSESVKTNNIIAPFNETDSGSDWSDASFGLNAPAFTNGENILSGEDGGFFESFSDEIDIRENESMDIHTEEKDITTGVIRTEEPSPVLPDDFSFENLLSKMSPASMPSASQSEAENRIQKKNGETEPSMLQPEEATTRLFEPDIVPNAFSKDLQEENPKPDIKEHQNRRDALLDVFFEAAGIQNKNIESASQDLTIMRMAGTLFREIVSGLVTVLRGRAEMKSGLRLDATFVAANGNNPLKFSPSIEDVLTALLTRNYPGFMDPVEAIRESFGNIMHHQMAMNAGMQAALEELLEKFDPQNIERQFTEGVLFHKKAKCWDKYCESYKEIADDTIDTVFSEAFARAYQEQIQRLTPSSNVNADRDK